MAQFVRLDQDDIVLAVGPTEASVASDTRGEYAYFVDDARVCVVGEVLPKAPECVGQESMFA